MKSDCSAILVLIALGIWLPVGCKANYEIGSSFTDSLETFADGAAPGDSFMVSDGTSFEWESLFLFNDGTVKSEIDEVIGAKLFGADDDRLATPGVLLVFVDSGKVVHSVMTSPPLKLLGLYGHGYQGDATVSLTDTRAAWLLVSDPNTEEE